MRTLLCCIGRQENQYIREYVEYYKDLGFTNICLYDNNYDGEERFEEVIGDYIESGFVILKDFRNRKVCQLDAYNDCYDTYFGEYDWIAFFDCDEFLTFRPDLSTAEKKFTVEDYLSNPAFENFNVIKVNWLCYGDSGKLRYEKGNIVDRLTEPIPFDKKVTYQFPENYHIKSIVKGGLFFSGKLFAATPHSTTLTKECNANGVQCKNDTSPFEPYEIEFATAYLRHYSTKTVEEYCNKMKRGFPDHIVTDEKRKEYVETRFFRYNEPTQEKIDIVKQELGIDMSYLILLPPVKFTGVKRKDVQLFMLCYDKKDYSFLDDAVVTPLQCGADMNKSDVCELKDNTGQNISNANYFFVENTGIFWIWKNITDANYIGQMQYRRRLTGIDESTDFEAIFKDYDVICAKPYNYPANVDYIPANTVKGGYTFSHCYEDLDDLEFVVKQLYPDYAKDWDKYITNGQDLYYSSGFVLSKEKYNEYCTFLFNCLSNWLKYNNIKNRDDLMVHVAKDVGMGKYIRFNKEQVNEIQTSMILWLMKIGGFLGERLWTIWLLHNIPPEKRYEVEYNKIEGTRI